MGLEALRSAIEAKGRARAAEILRQAEEQAAELLSQAQSAAARRRSEMLRREEAVLRAEAGKRVVAATAEARRRVLEARHALLDRVFAMAREELPEALDGAAGRHWLEDRLPQALQHMPEGPVVVRCSPDLVEVIRQQLVDRAGVRVDGDSEESVGFQVANASGSVVVDARLDRLLELARPRLAIRVLERLASGSVS